MQNIEQPTEMSEADWRSLGESLFGKSMDRWRFVCPTCGSTMSIEKARKLPEDQKERLRAGNGWSIEQECVGRYLTGVGCDWAAYGLFHGPFFVVRPSGNKTPVFGFDTTGGTP